MAVVGQSTRTKEYVLESDRELPVEQQTTFIIGTLSKRQFLDTLGVINEYRGSEDIKDVPKFFEDLERVARLGVRGWRNLKNTEGQDVPYDAERIADLTPVMLQELVMELIAFNTIGGRDRKNST